MHLCPRDDAAGLQTFALGPRHVVNQIDRHARIARSWRARTARGSRLIQVARAFLEHVHEKFLHRVAVVALAAEFLHDADEALRDSGFVHPSLAQCIAHANARAFNSLFRER